MIKKHKFFSNLTFNLAENHLGQTKANPSVGCVIVKNNSVISTGVTSINGRPHAEYNALNKKINFKGSQMYISLEPCTHHGLTPPCTNLIKKKKIKKVFYCCDDPDLRTFKKAKTVLKKNKISSQKINITNNNFYKSYFLNKKKQKPLIDAKIAISMDYYTINKNSKWITNTRARKVAHLLRSKYDCIVSTSSSINIDNSLLNCRIEGLDSNKPDLIIIDRYLKLKRNLKILNITHKRKTYIITTSDNKKKLSFFKKKKIKVIKIEKLESKKDFDFIFNKIFKIGKKRILIESGLVFLNELIKSRFINDLYVFKSHKKLKRYGNNNTKINYIKKLKLNNELKVNLNGNKLYKIGIK